MCLNYKDLDIATSKIPNTKHCYLTHPKRDGDTDDVILDAANQLDLSRKDLVTWITSYTSWEFMRRVNNMELEVEDFSYEFYKLCG